MNKIDSRIEEVRRMLHNKNEAYGDAALSPIRIFSDAKATDGLKVRIDDKLSRIRQVGLNDATEDTLLDLIGYLVLLSIANDDEKQSHMREELGGAEREDGFQRMADVLVSRAEEVVSEDTPWTIFEYRGEELVNQYERYFETLDQFIAWCRTQSNFLNRNDVRFYWHVRHINIHLEALPF